MDKKRPFVPISYFILPLLILLLFQNVFQRTEVETIAYSEFKSLLKSGMVTDLTIGDYTIRGNVKANGAKEILPPERLDMADEKRTGYPFVVVRVEDSELMAELERVGVVFRGEISSNWLPTLLSWVVPVALFFLLWSYLFKSMGAAVA